MFHFHMFEGNPSITASRTRGYIFWLPILPQLLRQLCECRLRVFLCLREVVLPFYVRSKVPAAGVLALVKLSIEYSDPPSQQRIASDRLGGESGSLAHRLVCRTDEFFHSRLVPLFEREREVNVGWLRGM